MENPKTFDLELSAILFYPGWYFRSEDGSFLNLVHHCHLRMGISCIYNMLPTDRLDIALANVANDLLCVIFILSNRKSQSFITLKSTVNPRYFPVPPLSSSFRNNEPRFHAHLYRHKCLVKRLCPFLLDGRTEPGLSVMPSGTRPPQEARPSSLPAN